MSSRTDPGVPTTSYISLYNTYKTQEKYENLTQNVYVLQLDRFRLQAPPIDAKFRCGSIGTTLRAIRALIHDEKHGYLPTSV
jgi:hypothetical protein